MSLPSPVLRRAAAALVAGATVLSLCALVPVSPADADASDYAALTSIDVDRAGGKESHIWDVDLQLDPNLDTADLEIDLGPRITGPRRGILTLGHTSGGSCIGDLQIVVDTSDTQDAVLQPAGSTPPPLSAPARSRAMTGRFTDSMLDGFVPTCASVRITDAAGTVYDAVAPKVLQTPIDQLHLALSPAVVQVPAGTPHRIHLRYWDRRFSDDAVAYDAQATLTTGAGLTATGSRFPVTRNDDDIETTLTNRPGLHDLTLAFGGGSVDSTTSTQRVYSPGGPLPAATGNLAGRSFASNGSSVSFLTKRFAYVGVPPSGVPTCTAAEIKHPEHGCERYEWDRASNLLQIGDWIGAPDKAATGTHAVRGTFWHHDSYCQDWAAPARGARFVGSWLRTYDLFTAGGDEDEDEFVTVSFTEKGGFTASYFSGGEYGGSQTLRGTYRVLAHGRLAIITGKHHVHSLGTLGVALDSSGRPDAAKAGLEVSVPAFYGISGLFTKGPRGGPFLTGRHASAPDTWTPASFGGATCK